MNNSSESMAISSKALNIKFILDVALPIFISSNLRGGKYPDIYVFTDLSGKLPFLLPRGNCGIFSPVYNQINSPDTTTLLLMLVYN